MNKPLEGKSALVTGGSRGIGAAIADALASHVQQRRAEDQLVFLHPRPPHGVDTERAMLVGRRSAGPTRPAVRSDPRPRRPG